MRNPNWHFYSKVFLGFTFQISKNADNIMYYHCKNTDFFLKYNES